MGMHLNPRMEPQSLPLALHSEDLKMAPPNNEAVFPSAAYPVYSELTYLFSPEPKDLFYPADSAFSESTSNLS